MAVAQRHGSGYRRCARLESRTIFAHACKLGLEGIVSKQREHPYRSGRSKAWLKFKNPTAPGVLRFKNEEPSSLPSSREMPGPLRRYGKYPRQVRHMATAPIRVALLDEARAVRHERYSPDIQRAVGPELFEEARSGGRR